MTEAATPDVTFSDVVLWLAAMAAVQFGDLGEAAEGGATPEPNLDAARQLIDTLAVLKEKTRGNLAPEEDRLLDQALYDLRMRFVQVRGQPQKRIIIP